MSYWGWRRLVVLILVSVWVTGCRTAQESAATISPTDYPQITLIVRVPTATRESAQKPPAAPTLQPPVAMLASPTATVYTVQPGDTLLGIASKFGIPFETLQAANGNIAPQTLQIGQQLIIPSPRTSADGFPILATPTPPPLELPPPTCYETRTDSLLCLGRIDNPLANPLTHVAVKVYLFAPDGSVMDMQQAVIEQVGIAPGMSAPYQVRFTVDGDYLGTAAALISAVVAPESITNLAEVQVEDVAGFIDNGQYVLTGRIYNPGLESATVTRLVLTVFDEVGHVIGYRVLQTHDGIAPGKSLPIRVPVMLQAESAAPTHSITIEASPGE